MLRAEDFRRRVGVLGEAGIVVRIWPQDSSGQRLATYMNGRFDGYEEDKNWKLYILHIADCELRINAGARKKQRTQEPRNPCLTVRAFPLSNESFPSFLERHFNLPSSIFHLQSSIFST